MQTVTQGHRGTVTKHAFTQTHTTFAHAQLWIHSGSTQLTSMPTQPPLETVLPLKFKSSLSPSTLWPCCRTQLPCCQPNKPTSNSELTVSASPEQVEIKIHSRGDSAQHGVLAASGVGPFMSGQRCRTPEEVSVFPSV